MFPTPEPISKIFLPVPKLVSGDGCGVDVPGMTRSGAFAVFSGANSGNSYKHQISKLVIQILGLFNTILFLSHTHLPQRHYAHGALLIFLRSLTSKVNIIPIRPKCQGNTI